MQFDTLSQRLMEVIQEECNKWVEAMVTEAFNPAQLVSILKVLGFDDPSAFATQMGQQQGFNPYRVLGLEHDAGDEEVKTRYRVLLHKLHPDTAGAAGTEFLLQMVMAAYKTISMERGWG
jgi:DnaJ-domain-containing protein 1